MSKYMSQPFTNKKSGQSYKASSFVRTNDWVSSQGSMIQVQNTTSTKLAPAPAGAFQRSRGQTNTQQIAYNNIREQKRNNKNLIQPKQIIESVAPVPKVFN